MIVPDINTPEIEDISKLQKQIFESRTYKLDLESGRIVGFVDGLDAVVQAVHKILYTERYIYKIYSWQYGLGIEEYLGKDTVFVMTDLERNINSALKYDNRVEQIKDFNIKLGEIDEIIVYFNVHTPKGEVPKEVRLRRT